MSTSDGYGYC